MMNPDNSVAAVVVTYNRKELLRNCVEHLLSQDGAKCDILIIDNASSDGTREMLESEFDNSSIRYLNTGSNIGGAGGFMCGIEAAAMMGYEYVWIMDDDCLPSVTALRELLTFGNRLGSDWGFLSSAVYWTDGSLCKANRAKRDLFRHVDSVSENDEAIRIVMGSFVSMLVPTKVIREVGLPIGEYFIWTDDYEFSGRVSKRYPSYLVPASKVIHAMAENTRADLAEAEGERINRFRILYRNDVHCYSGHGLPGRVYLVAKALYTAFDVGMRTEADGRKLKFRVLMEGYRDGLCFNPEISYPHIINGNETSHGDSSSMGSVSDSNYSAMVEG